MNRAVAVLIAATILISVGSGATWYLRRPVPQSSYYGVTLSDGKPEVLYKLGVPQHVTGPPELSGVPKGWVPVYDVDGDPTSDKNALPPGKKYSDFDGWEYVSSKTSADRINVDFGKADGKIRNIDCYSGSKNVESCDPILRIRIGDTEDRLKSILGSPTYEQLLGTAKLVVYS